MWLESKLRCAVVTHATLEFGSLEVSRAAIRPDGPIKPLEIPRPNLFSAFCQARRCLLVLEICQDWASGESASPLLLLIPTVRLQSGSVVGSTDRGVSPQFGDPKYGESTGCMSGVHPNSTARWGDSTPNSKFGISPIPHCLFLRLFPPSFLGHASDASPKQISGRRHPKWCGLRSSSNTSKFPSSLVKPFLLLSKRSAWFSVHYSDYIRVSKHRAPQQITIPALFPIATL